MDYEHFNCYIRLPRLGQWMDCHNVDCHMYWMDCHNVDCHMDWMDCHNVDCHIDWMDCHMDGLS